MWKKMEHCYLVTPFGFQNVNDLLNTLFFLPERTSTRERRRVISTEISSVIRSTPSLRHLEERDSLPLRSLHSVSTVVVRVGHIDYKGPE